jgi:nucleotide-binding universal stress UspA family protein
MFETIIVPLDGSELAEGVLPQATEVARQFGSRIVLVQTVESLTQRVAQQPALLQGPGAAIASYELLQKAVEGEMAAARSYLSGVRDRLSGQGFKVEAVFREGDAPDAIIALANDEKAGLIAMASHGRGGLGRLVFGSVADAVLRHSNIPVLLVRSKV